MLVRSALQIILRPLDNKMMAGSSDLQPTRDIARRAVLPQRIYIEAQKANSQETRAYLLGAIRDGTFNELHRTLRISQSDIGWLQVLQLLFLKLGKRSWIYREGNRNVWVVETTWRAEESAGLETCRQRVAFVRGYFDAEGGVPRRPEDRFYIQMTQKDRPDLEQTRQFLEEIGIHCGKVHNPSVRVDPEYWRFYVLARSHEDFIRHVWSWHPRKRSLLEARLETGNGSLTHMHH
jgi:hypothetical protein